MKVFIQQNRTEQNRTRDLSTSYLPEGLKFCLLQIKILLIGVIGLLTFNDAFCQCTALPFTTVTTTWTISSGSPTYSGIYRIPIGQTLLITGSTTNVTFNGLQLQMKKMVIQ